MSFIVITQNKPIINNKNEKKKLEFAWEIFK